jgi:hypothetical protein
LHPGVAGIEAVEGEGEGEGGEEETQQVTFGPRMKGSRRRSLGNALVGLPRKIRIARPKAVHEILSVVEANTMKPVPKRIIAVSLLLALSSLGRWNYLQYLSSPPPTDVSLHSRAMHSRDHYRDSSSQWSCISRSLSNFLPLPHSSLCSSWFLRLVGNQVTRT